MPDLFQLAGSSETESGFCILHKFSGATLSFIFFQRWHHKNTTNWETQTNRNSCLYGFEIQKSKTYGNSTDLISSEILLLGLFPLCPQRVITALVCQGHPFFYRNNSHTAAKLSLKTSIYLNYLFKGLPPNRLKDYGCDVKIRIWGRKLSTP